MPKPVIIESVLDIEHSWNSQTDGELKVIEIKQKKN